MALPECEKTARVDKVRHLIEGKGLDFALIYFDEYNVMNGRYLTGWCPSVERGAVIVSNHCEPFLIGGPEAGPYAKLESAIKETVSCIAFMVPEEEYPMATICNFRQISDKYFHGRQIKRVGLVGSHSIPLQVYSQLVADLSGAEIVDITDDYEKLRYVKSDWEIDQMREAFHIADKSFARLMEGVVEGNREYEAAAEAEYVVRKMGGDGLGYRTIIGTAERSIGIIPVYSDRVFSDGEMVLAGISPRYNGYSSTACCPIVVGDKANDTQRRWTNDICEALYLAKEALRPGMTGTEIDGVPRRFLLGKGYEKYMTMAFVHNCGLCEFEKPFFGPSSHDIVQENEVICIDIALFNNEEIPGIRVETAYLVTSDSAEPMSTYMEGLFGFGKGQTALEHAAHLTCK